MRLNFQTIAASIRGTKEEGIPNQDYFMTDESEEHLALVIADGLGASIYSQEGAKRVCEIVIDKCKAPLDQKRRLMMGDEIVTEWYDQIELLQWDSRSYQTTCLWVYIDKVHKEVVIGQIGDGIIAVKSDEFGVEVFSLEKEFLNETACLGGPNKEQFKVERLSYENSLKIFLATDGISDDIEETKIVQLCSYLEHKFELILPKDREQELIVELKNTMDNKYCDDRTLIFSWV